MGRAKGWITGSCAGARIAGRDGEPGLAYIPARTQNGKIKNQQVTFTVYINSTKGTGRDGTPGRSDRFNFVAYGALADSLCRSMSNGKAIDAILKPNSYEGRLFDANRAMRLEADGTPIIVEKTGFQIVESPTYGEDSQKTIDREVAEGRRPVNWNVANHPDSATWIQMLKDRSNVQYVPGSKVFGYARVIDPAGQGVVQIAQAATGPAAKAATDAARALGNAQSATTGTYVPPVVAPVTVPATSAATVALTPEQLAQAVAQITGAQAGATIPPVKGVDPKTGFATANTPPVSQTVAF